MDGEQPGPPSATATSTAAQAGGPVACTAADLRTAKGRAGAAGGNEGYVIVFTDAGTRPPRPPSPSPPALS